MKDYVNKGEDIHGRLVDIGVKYIDEEAMVNKLISGLPEDYVSLRTVWSSVIMKSSGPTLSK